MPLVIMDCCQAQCQSQGNTVSLHATHTMLIIGLSCPFESGLKSPLLLLNQLGCIVAVRRITS
jgi:hypothetical protein